MKTITIAVAGTVALSVLFGIGLTGYAGQERSGEKQDRAVPQQSSPRQAQPAQQQRAQSRQARPQQEQRQSQSSAAPQQQRRAQQQRQPQTQGERQTRAPRPPSQNQDRQQRAAQQAGNNGRSQRIPDQRRFEQSTWQQHSAGNWQSDHRNWQQRGGYSGYRIPDDRYRGYFGREHGFRIGGLPFLVVEGYPRFQYNGYWFSLVDPYPGSWAANWYDTDDVYVDYVDNGYYLYNRRYPGVGLAISISM
jgi:hypothetical protein